MDFATIHSMIDASLPFSERHKAALTASSGHLPGSNKNGAFQSGMGEVSWERCQKSDASQNEKGSVKRRPLTTLGRLGWSLFEGSSKLSGVPPQKGKPQRTTPSFLPGASRPTIALVAPLEIAREGAWACPAAGVRRGRAGMGKAAPRPRFGF